MPVWLDPTGRATYGLGLCARCSRKKFLDQLFPDPNAPGLMVCAEDLDVLDPYRLPARQTEQINLPFTRPDVDLTDGLTFGTGIPPYPNMPVFNILAQRLVDEFGQAIMTADGQYIDLTIDPGPLDLP